MPTSRQGKRFMKILVMSNIIRISDPQYEKKSSVSLITPFGWAESQLVGCFGLGSTAAAVRLVVSPAVAILHYSPHSFRCPAAISSTAAALLPLAGRAPAESSQEQTKMYQPKRRAAWVARASRPLRWPGLVPR